MLESLMPWIAGVFVYPLIFELLIQVVYGLGDAWQRDKDRALFYCALGVFAALFLLGRC